MEHYKVELGPEAVPTKAEVLEVIGQFAEGVTVTKELSDAKGLYLLEATKTDASGEVVEYQYTRYGRFPNENQASITAIHVVYYVNRIAISGVRAATLGTDGKWVDGIPD